MPRRLSKRQRPRLPKRVRVRLAPKTSAWKMCWVAARRRPRQRPRKRPTRFRRSKARRSKRNWWKDFGPASVLTPRVNLYQGICWQVAGLAGATHRSGIARHPRREDVREMSTSTVNISAAQVKELRDKSGAPMMDCKKALAEAKGDLEQAIVLLRKRGTALAERKAGRVTSEGSVASYIHAGGKIGVLVEVNCESDFVPRSDDFKELVHDVAMHIAASDPKFVRKEDVTPEAYAREKEIFLAQAVASGKPPHIAEKMVAGKVEKFYEDVCLLEQPFIKDQTISVGQLIAGKVGKLGENIAVRRFARFKVGEAGMPVASTTQTPDEGGEAAPAK